MITNGDSVRKLQNDNCCDGTATSQQNQVAAIPANNNIIARVSGSSSSDEWSSSDEEGGKQVAEISPQAPTENGVKIINTYTDCANISSAVHNTNIYKNGVTVNHNLYCCPSSLDCVVKWCGTRRRIIIITGSVLAIFLIIFLGVWLSNIIVSEQPNDVEAETTSIIPTTENIPHSTTTVVPPISTDSTSSTTIISTSTDSVNGSTTEIPNEDWKIVKRNDWGAASPTSPPVELDILPPMYVIFSETETETCTTAQKCIEIVRNIQAEQMKNGLDDIAYNFLIGGDGMVYEGRGWDVHPNYKNYDTEYFSDLCISVSFIGNFDVDAPTDTILQTAKTLLAFGSQNNKLVKSPKCKCLRQFSHHMVKNPGDKLYEIIKTWKGWDNRKKEAFNPVQSYDHSWYDSYKPF